MIGLLVLNVRTLGERDRDRKLSGTGKEVVSSFIYITREGPPRTESVPLYRLNTPSSTFYELAPPNVLPSSLESHSSSDAKRVGVKHD